MKTKMRIKLLDSDLKILEDRLIDQDGEFLIGPKEKHQGPLSLEIVLRDKDDIDKFKNYIGKLLENLPIPIRKSYGKPKVSIALMDEEPLKILLSEIEEKCKTQDDVIKYLRERNFKFVTTQFLQDRQMPIEIQKKHIDYQYLIRLIKESKDPKNDKYDPQLLLGMKIMGKKVEMIKVYLYNKFLKTIKLPWAVKSDINFKKIRHIRFPHFMIQIERDKYSLEKRKMALNPELKPSKFFTRWEPAVIEANK